MSSVQRPAGFTAHFPSSGSAFRFLASPDFSLTTPDSAPAVPTGGQTNGTIGGVSFTLSDADNPHGVTHNIFATSQSAPASPEANVPGACRICQDKATGKHYGALSCDGCKGFFRRTIRKSQRYVCRYNKNCTIDKDKRNSCRYCRYRKCITAGMKREAVQNERDRISSRKIMGSAQENIDMLMAAEQVCLQLRSSVIHSLPHHRQAGMVDLSESIKQQLLLLVEWAKNLPVFSRFEIREQVSLLRSYGSQHLLLGVARRSIKYDGRILMLGNESFLSRDQPTEFPDIQRLTGRILDELVQPMQELDLDECEFVLLKAIMFFNPHAQSLKSKELVREMRHGFITSLESYVQEKYPGNKGRVGSLYLMLPSLQLISHQMVESLQAATFFGVARLDKLLHEILLENEDSGDITGAFLHTGASLPARRYSGNATAASLLSPMAVPNGHCSSAPSSPSSRPTGGMPKDEYIPNGLYH